MQLPEVPLIGTYDRPLVALSVIIAVLASGAALDFAGRVAATRGRLRMLWLAGGACAMGFGIWSMHYTGMLALKLPVSTRYHLPTVVLSLIAAVLASSVALLVAGRARLTPTYVALGSVVMGSGIAAMHYIGMAAMRLPAMMRWNPWLVGASIAIAIVVSAVALWLAFRLHSAGLEHWSWTKVGSALVMGAAIPSMHYTGMAAATFMASSAAVDPSYTIGSSALGTAAIVIATVLVMLAAIASSIVDRRLSLQAGNLRRALEEVMILRGLLPVCAYCKRVRTNRGEWEHLETYVPQPTDKGFSHGICPECVIAWEQGGAPGLSAPPGS